MFRLTAGRDGISIPGFHIAHSNETPQQQIKRLRASWSILDGEDETPVLVPTVTMCGPGMLPLLSIFGQRNGVELYTMSESRQELGYASFVRTGFASAIIEDMVVRMDGNEIETFRMEPARIRLFGKLPLATGDIVKIVDPAIAPERPTGEQQLLVSLAMTDEKTYSDLRLVQEMRTRSNQLGEVMGISS